jgi:hypothetical protein
MQKEFEIINGIKSFIRSDEIDGNNKKYQKMYDKIAPFYNFSNKIYFWLKFGGEAIKSIFVCKFPRSYEA